MKTQINFAPGRGLKVTSSELRAGTWLVRIVGPGRGKCPDCGYSSVSRHSGYVRILRDLPVQGSPVKLEVSLSRLRCRRQTCPRSTFVEPGGPELERFARMTHRVQDLLVMTGHTAGGRPAQRLLRRLGLPGSTDTVLRHLKQRAVKPVSNAKVRVVGIDEWAWRKGYGNYGTIIIDLERREVLDVMQDRTAERTANWFREHPEVEIITRDRCGLYSQGAREGAPQARQCADRFHILQNLRQAIECQLNQQWNKGRETVSGEVDEPVRGGLRSAKFDAVKQLQAEGANAAKIWRRTGVGMRAILELMGLETLPERKRMAPRRANPALFHEQLKAAWEAGTTHGRRLHAEIKRLGYTGSFSHLARYLSPWRKIGSVPAAADVVMPESMTFGMSRPPVPPIPGSALCISPAVC